MNNAWRPMALLAVLSGVLFSINLGGYDVWPPDEPRFAEVAREMFQSGDYLVPHINGEPYKEKPPLLFWTIAALSKPFGAVTETTTRIPSVISGVLVVLLTYALARRLYDPRLAFWAAVVLITAWRFWWQARFGQIDMLLTLWMTAFLYAFWRWHESRHWPWLLAMYLAVAAGVMSKGPGIVVFPVLLTASFYWREKSAWRAMHPILGACLVGGLYALWMIPARMGTQGPDAHAAIASNLFRQTIGRFGGVNHVQMPWYYLIQLPIDWMPWSLFLPWAVVWTWKQRRDGDRMRLLLCWTVPAFLFFSTALGKRQIYLLPLAPTLGILLACGILDFMGREKNRARTSLAILWTLFLLVLGAAPLALLMMPEYRDAWKPTLWIFPAMMSIMAGISVYHLWSENGKRLHQLMAVQMALVLTLTAGVAFPVINPFTSAKNICAIPRAWSESGVDYDLYSAGFSREEYVFYSKHLHTPVLCDMLPMDPQGHTLREIGEAQRKLLRVISKAAGTVPVASFASLTPTEIEALGTALQKAVDESGVEPEMRTKFEEALRGQLDAFFTQFARERPALCLVQEEDWRWILALHPAARDLLLLRHQDVGSRQVMLLANAAASKIEKHD